MDRTCRLPRRCAVHAAKGILGEGRLFYAPTARGAAWRGTMFYCETEGRRSRRRKSTRRRRRRSGPCEARGHSRLCKPYRSAHYLAARRLSNNIMVQRQRAAHKRRSRCTGHDVSHARAHTYALIFVRNLCARATRKKRRRTREG